MKKFKSIFKILRFKKEYLYLIPISNSPEPNLTGCPEEYVEIPVRALEMKTRLRLAEYLDTKGKLLKVELDNIQTEIMNDFTGLVKLSGQEGCRDFVEFKNQPKSPTITLLDRWIGHDVTIGKFWEYLLILQRHDVIQECSPMIMSDCQNYFDQIKNPASARKRPNYYVPSSISASKRKYFKHVKYVT
ncbi:hypothetical protein DPMN_052634 [Dreissena polymorpha]|uniref:Uncharacterized protein n=1 Tax=Dreissena polymorpha TaxID=45954 RepID=A0A9D4CK12_DREPO|nr:hypothetical protein DPMN_052634 [Dreissena polymorpha]